MRHECPPPWRLQAGLGHARWKAGSQGVQHRGQVKKELDPTSGWSQSGEQVTPIQTAHWKFFVTNDLISVSITPLGLAISIDGARTDDSRGICSNHPLSG